MHPDNIFAGVPENIEEELFSVLLKNENIKIQRIVSKGQVSPATGWYDQPQDEWVLVLKGEAIISFENKEIKMQTGSFVNIPAHTKHKVSWTHPDIETLWLAIYY